MLPPGPMRTSKSGARERTPILAVSKGDLAGAVGGRCGGGGGLGLGAGEEGRCEGEAASGGEEGFEEGAAFERWLHAELQKKDRKGCW